MSFTHPSGAPEKPPRSRFKLPQTEKGTQMASTAEYPQIFDLVRAALRFIDAFFRSAAQCAAHSWLSGCAVKPPNGMILSK